MATPCHGHATRSTLTTMAANNVTRLVYKRRDNKWAWNLRVGSNIIATDGGQGYENFDDCKKMADAIISGYYADAEKKRRNEPSDGRPKT